MDLHSGGKREKNEGVKPQLLNEGAKCKSFYISRLTICNLPTHGRKGFSGELFHLSER